MEDNAIRRFFMQEDMSVDPQFVAIQKNDASGGTEFTDLSFVIANLTMPAVSLDKYIQSTY